MTGLREGRPVKPEPGGPGRAPGLSLWDLTRPYTYGQSKGAARVALNEHDKLLRDIVDECQRLGLWWSHAPDSRTVAGHRGAPDLIIGGRHGFTTVEVKSADGRLTREQMGWAARLQHYYGWHLWRPDDWAGTAPRSLLRMLAR